ncbi:hypothetical protein BHF71_02015 [Vulcanibacillus modesticaldus]|uniref:Na+/H+ antiporter NhaC-like C-terminal domain-containing protein n=1 Tax=Vulcanibacillus modesticaldus TaxID=337097 RepID=A0A1D2YUN5_9BACI|nr:Na+/H+ antiporter NhaC family protein [Vulcanibacillus modesticaldus]OEF99383.1 hypothetical protein BHF71_02015 [Vulcanibacillus modesticaldus]
MDYGWISIIPPLLTIVLAIVTKEVFFSLGVGIFTGALILSDYNLFTAFEKTFTTLFENVGDSTWNIPILAFLLILGGLTSLMAASGGSRAFGNWATSRVKTRQGAQWLTFIAGLIIFIDDYFNTLTVGNVSRPITDRKNISRAKLAYILDTTAAPVVILAPLSSWGAYIVSLIGDNLSKNGVTIEPLSAYVQMIPMNFYAILSLFMVATLIILKLDFGPMDDLEQLAINTGNVSAGNGKVEEEIEVLGNGKVYDLLLPIVTLIVSTVFTMLYTGGYFTDGSTLMTAFLNTDVANSLVYGGMITLIFTALLYLPRKIVPLNKFIPVTINGMKSMFTAILILALAWGIGGIISELGTGEYLASLMGINFPTWTIPAVLFVISGLMAFSTGTSWGTFGIMLPLGAEIMFELNPEMILPAMAAVLAGSVFGDHASPISDTTILSSAGAGANHIDHVNTQLPYATTVAIVSLFGYLLLGFTGQVLLSLGLSLILLIAILIYIRQRKSNKESLISTEKVVYNNPKSI